MTLKNQVKNVYGVGLNNVGSYQVSGKPFITASTVTDGAEKQIEFSEVSNNITVKLDSAGGVTKNGYVMNGSLRLIDKNPGYVYGQNESYVMWFRRVNPDNDSDHYLFRIPSNMQILYNTTSHNLRLLHFKTDNSNITVSSSLDLTTNTPMTHFVITVDHDASAKLYHNGNTTPILTIDLSDNGDGHVGKVGGQDFTLATHGADMDWGFIEVARFNTTLNAAAVAEAYNSGNYLDLTTHSDASSLINYWTFGDNPDDSFSGSGGSLVVSVKDTVGSIELIANSAGGTDTVEAFTHTFGGGGGELRVHFRSTGSSNVATNKHYWTLDSQNESITMNVKSKELYLSADGGDCDYSVEAELTNIPSSRMFQHTGSGVDE